MGNSAVILFSMAFVALVLQQTAGLVKDLQYEVDESTHDVWPPDSLPKSFLCPKNACHYTNIGGVETFQLLNQHTNRLEVKVHNTYTSGTHVFQGKLRISPPLFDECLFQIFGGSDKATQFMLRAYSGNGGKLTRYEHDVLATGVDNAWVDVKIVHDKGNYVEAFINNVSKGKWPDTDRDVPNNFKYGVYGSLKTSNARVQWKDVSIS
ncbi:hypothetical protein O6H91_18G041900 [Diphasiastrum complanatum]|uniref:Uncharacterized protein n=1 Tax=Diphasiastrum complanatum TaxID=34168 RepID=A0ACC2B0F6_DIPCM|nr:hypothetical protein O6H91_Y551900 [Diphasiastrum complanatum]KAJ7298082.1 hypothetical protein O6H91_Y018000 [Diphasiastrum complanatum]KAJ7523220.1 hypothetical protein O6H91_18G041900 [Diphasiastrum complanatum]